METMPDRVTRLLLQHAQTVPGERPLPPALSIRNELAVESLSLVSVLVDLGAELDVDVTESGVELSRIQTVGDLIAVGNELAASRPAVA
jgi:acyl carrier protein